LGYVEQKALRFIYHKAELLCFPSLYEGFGIPLAEAMAVGCPVTCSNAASIPEVVGDAALLFNPNSPEEIATKVITLWRNDELRKRLIKLGKEKVKKFSAKNMAQIHQQAFAKAMGSYRKTRYLFYKYAFEPIHSYKMRKKRKRLPKQ
jgi:glycosyltransferase involved in cell wall biosynthesis